MHVFTSPVRDLSRARVIDFSQSLLLQQTLPLLTECLRFFYRSFFLISFLILFFLLHLQYAGFWTAKKTQKQIVSQQAITFFRTYILPTEIFTKIWLKTYTKRQKCNILLNKKGGFNNAKNQSNSSYRRNQKRISRA